MQSIPQAMIWEVWRRGRWTILAAGLGAIALPSFVLAVLRQEGPVHPLHPSQIVMHFVLLLINLPMFMAAVGTVEPPARFYALPVTTASLVAWRMMPAMAVVALLSAASTAVLNATFGLGWPILGPALFASAFIAALQAALWSTEKSGWEVVALAFVATTAVLWFKSRYGATFSQPSGLWTHVTAQETAIMAAAAVLSYFVAVNGLSRARRGDTLPGIGIIAWLNRLLDPAAYGGRFSSAAHAQLWFEWRRKGWVLPTLVVAGMIIGGCIWSIGNRTALGLREGFLAGGGLLAMAGLIVGFLLGNCGSSDADLSMAQFLATRPMTTTEMARTILKTGAKSLLLAWTVWFVTYWMVAFTLRAIEGPTWPLLPRGAAWWYFPASLIAAWTTMGLTAWIAMAGRSRLLVQLFSGLFLTFLTTSMMVKFALSREAGRQFLAGFLIAVSLLCVVATVTAFVAARRRDLIGWPTIYTALSLSVALAALAFAADILQIWQHPPVMAAIVGIASLAVAPLATAPLALAWNRTR